MAFDDDFVAAVRDILRDHTLDKAFAAEVLTLPDEGYIAEQMTVIDVEAIHDARESLRRVLADSLRSDFRQVYEANKVSGSYSPDPVAAGQRSLRNVALWYLAALAGRGPDILSLVTTHYRTANNMTDLIAALRLLVDLDAPERQEALDDFYERYESDPLVVDKWLALQAMSSRPDTLERVRSLLHHPSFSPRNPNKVRALIGTFTSANPLRYHAADGSGYAFHADCIRELDAINPQIAARLLQPLGRWARFDEGRQAKMKDALARVLAAPGLSRAVYEIASKSLGDQPS